jgi:serine/threonine protein kinase
MKEMKCCNMETSRICQQCQQPLPENAPEGLCPACLAKVALGSEPATPGATINVNPLPDDLLPELRSKCLLKTGLATEPQAGPMGTIVISAEHFSPRLPQPGGQLGHYRIVRSLGSGGMGTVFEAEDLENGRRVALKVLSQTLDSPDSRRRFFREGRLAASINHPNSV